MVRITVGGLPGSGTTTACRGLHERLGIEYVYAGQIFRLMAAEHGMTLTEFGRYCEENPQVDKELDERQLKLLNTGDLILEGRLSGWLAHDRNVPALKFWLAADADVRAERIVKREGGDLATRKAEMLEREFSESKRYRTYYGVDLDKMDYYDVIIDTSDLTPEEVLEEMLEAVEERVADEAAWELPKGEAA